MPDTDAHPDAHDLPDGCTQPDLLADLVPDPDHRAAADRLADTLDRAGARTQPLLVPDGPRTLSAADRARRSLAAPIAHPHERPRTHAGAGDNAPCPAGDHRCPCPGPACDEYVTD